MIRMLVSGTLTADQVHELKVFFSVETVAVFPEMFPHRHKLSFCKDLPIFETVSNCISNLITIQVLVVVYFVIN
jgi:hypothetical protein